MRLIDADKLIELTRKDMKYAFDNGFLDMAFEREHLIKVIRNQPTAYDIHMVIDFQEWLKTQIVGVDNTTNEILVVVDDMWVLAIDKFKESFDKCNEIAEHLKERERD